MKKYNPVSFLILITLMLGSFSINNYASNYKVSSVTEINSLLNTLQPGDTVLMANKLWMDAKIVFRGKGTPENPIYLLAETPGDVILSGSSSLKIAGEYLVVDGLYFKNGYSTEDQAVIEFRNGSSELSSYCRLTNSAVVDYNPSSKSIQYKWISLYGNNNRVDHCYIKGKSHDGTTLVVWLSNKPNYHQIDHNYFGYRPPLGFNGGETIRVGTSDWSMFDSYTTVEYNYFEECDGEIEIISSKSGENIYQYNTFYKCDGMLTLRHGNRCTVKGNFFFGANKSGSGGVRIIGEDHKVYNNYFEGLKGSGYQSALTIMNGVPNSPLNRYFQVKNAVVAFNTFVDNYSNFNIGAGKSSELSLPPLDCIIDNNIVKSNSSPIIRYTDTPLNITYSGNVMFGASLGITMPEGISLIDPQLIFSSDTLWRPGTSSPIIDAAVGNYEYITDDIDGQPRSLPKDIGCDEVSNSAVTKHPLTPKDVGPKWQSKILRDGIIYVTAGQDSLLSAISRALPGDVIELITDGGNYPNNGSILIDKDINIRAKRGLLNKPIITNNNPSSSTRIIIEIKEGGKLNLTGIVLDGLSNTSTPAKYLIRTDDSPMVSKYLLEVDDCILKDVVIGTDGNFFRAYPGTVAEKIKFTNCLFTNSGKEGIRLKDETNGSGKFNVEIFEITNCTFWNIPKEAIYIYGGDSDPNSPGPITTIDHCTFDNCGNANAMIINATDVDGIVIKSSIFSNSPANQASIKIEGKDSKIIYSNLFNVGDIIINRDAVIGSGILEVDPTYEDRLNGNFRLPSNSFLISKAADWRIMGDLRWDPNLTSVDDEENKAIIDNKLLLNQNYPNPFNPVTNISYYIPSLRSNDNKNVKLMIYDMLGREIETLVNKSQPAGFYTISYDGSELPSGVYIYKIIYDSFSFSKKMLLLK